MKYLSLKTGVLFRLGLIRLFYREGEKKNLNSLSVGYSDQFCQVHGHEITYPESFQRQLKVLKANRPYVFSLSPLGRKQVLHARACPSSSNYSPGRQDANVCLMQILQIHSSLCRLAMSLSCGGVSMRAQ